MNITSIRTGNSTGALSLDSDSPGNISTPDIPMQTYVVVGRAISDVNAGLRPFGKLVLETPSKWATKEVVYDVMIVHVPRDHQRIKKR